MKTKKYKRASLQTQKKAIELYLDGFSFSYIGKNLGYSKNSVGYWLKKNNIEIKLKSKIVNCAFCGKEKSIFPSVIKIKKMKNHFCNRICKGKWEKLNEVFKGKNNPKYVPKIETECATCGKRMKVYTCRLPESGKVYCGRECQHDGMRKGLKVHCAVCGKEFYRTLSHYNRQGRGFCSLECVAIANSGDGNVNWAGGISHEPYCPVWLDKEFKENIKARDDYRCQNPDCWHTADHLPLCIMHIDNDKKNCHPDNLITGCFSCNSRAQKDREWHTSWYNAIMQRSGKLINKGDYSYV